MDGPPVRVGVMDWGVGGLGALAALRRRFPRLDLAYASDSGFTPYGLVPAEVLAARVAAVARALDVTHLVVACNAASTVIDAAALPIPSTGVIAHGVTVALASAARRIAILGGQRTIDAGHHAQALAAHGVVAIPRVAQPLSAHVEAGRLDGPALEADVAAVCAPLRGQVDAALLACTHYPAIAPVLARHLPGVALLDPVDALVDWIAARWSLDDAPGDGALTAMTSGDPDALRIVGLAAFGVALDPGAISTGAVGSISA